ncbi:MAG: hypothetical protein K1X55_18065 [Chitinophagales bacterium]|nr:hypothetical protein [Chitinophagales bacterium]
MIKKIMIWLVMCIPLLMNAQQSISLITPIDEDTIHVAYPLFTWTTVTSSAPTIYYNIKIVEVLTGQTKAAAMSNNTAVFDEDYENTGIISYPVYAPEFDPCKQYAWKVEATILEEQQIGENQYQTVEVVIGTSDIAVFYTDNCNVQSRLSGPVPANFFMKLNKETSNFIYFFSKNENDEKVIGFKYIEDYSNVDFQDLQVKIRDLTDNTLSTVSSSNLIPAGVPTQDKYGVHYLNLNLSSLDFDTPYQLEITTSKNDIYKAKFQFFEPE